LINHEDLLNRIQDKGNWYHDCPDAHACTCHPEHKECNKDLLRRRFSELPCFLLYDLTRFWLLRFQVLQSESYSFLYLRSFLPQHLQWVIYSPRDL
jgi:hypothetical protein